MDRRRWLLLPPAIWIFSLFLIQILSGFTAPNSSEIPDQCPENSQNCARVIMEFEGSPEAVHSAAMDWIDSQAHTTIEQQTESTSHTIFRTQWMMFQDDFFLETGCTENATWIQVHSESRLGTGDMGVNQNRVDTLLDYLAKIEFDVSDC